MVECGGTDRQRSTQVLLPARSAVASRDRIPDRGEDGCEEEALWAAEEPAVSEQEAVGCNTRYKAAKPPSYRAAHGLPLVGSMPVMRRETAQWNATKTGDGPHW